jgi:RNA polymerase sigma-70 factor (ECF subfamily)
MIEAHVYSLPAINTGYRPGSCTVAPDEALIERIAAGDGQGMRALFARHNVRVFRFVLNIVRDRALAEEIVGDVFFDVWRQAGQFDARAKVSTWLLAIARHKAFSALRRRRVHEKLDDALAIEDPTESPEMVAQRKDRDEVLRHCIMKLSRSHREVLDLVYYHEKSIESVAEIIGIPLNTVKTRMFYARKCLAALLLEAGVDRAAL